MQNASSAKRITVQYIIHQSYLYAYMCGIVCPHIYVMYANLAKANSEYEIGIGIVVVAIEVCACVSVCVCV